MEHMKQFNVQYIWGVTSGDGLKILNAEKADPANQSATGDGFRARINYYKTYSQMDLEKVA